jgi:hypothetical protein
MKVSEYRSGLPGAPAQFVLDAYESGETVEAASRRWMAQQAEEIVSLKAEVDSLKAQKGRGHVRA